MISFRHVYKNYGGNLSALRDITFQIEKGEFVFVTGPSGAGKTTLFKLISSQEKVSSGGLEVAGYSLNQIDKKQIPFFRRKIGVIYQDFKLLLDRSVFENVSLPLLVQGVKPTEIAARVEKVLDEVGLRFKKRKLPQELSGGEQQRVAIARAIVHQPDVVIADEPTGNLDAEMSQHIISLLEKINAQGTTLLVATHDPLLIQKHRQRRLHLQSGCLETRVDL